MTKCGKCCYYSRLVVTFLFSHIGIVALLLGYALVGAVVFRVLEAEHETLQRAEMRHRRTLMIANLSRMTNQSAVLDFKNWTLNAGKILLDFEQEFLHAVKYKGYDGG